MDWGLIMQKSLVLVPVYNEELNIININNQLIELSAQIDYIFINDGSTDNTEKILIENNIPHLSLISNLGIGGAVQTGYKYAYQENYDYAIQFDGDGQHNPKYISQMIQLLSSNKIDMVIGSRFVEKTSYDQTFFRMLGIKITSIIIKLLTNFKIYDTTSGFRAINKSIIKEFAKNYPYDYPEPCTNMEMILKGKIIKEIPVEMNKRENGVSSISPLKSIKYMIKVILSLFLMRVKKY